MIRLFNIASIAIWTRGRSLCKAKTFWLMSVHGQRICVCVLVGMLADSYVGNREVQMSRQSKRQG